MPAFNIIDRVRLISPNSHEYQQHLQQMDDDRPARGGRRNLGEQARRGAKQVVRTWLTGYIPMEENRVLAWHEGSLGTRYHEFDGVQRVDTECLCVYEIQFMRPENMQHALGPRQLDAALPVLFAGNLCRAVRRRLVYVSDTLTPAGLGTGLPLVEPRDSDTEIGVIWIQHATLMAWAWRG